MKNEIYIPQFLKQYSTWQKGRKKYPNNINAQKKEEKADTDYIWKVQAKESLLSLRLAKIQKEALCLMLQARNLMLPNLG